MVHMHIEHFKFLANGYIIRYTICNGGRTFVTKTYVILDVCDPDVCDQDVCDPGRL